jgi:carbon-monoxide dehydrogenase small subunit
MDDTEHSIELVVNGVSWQGKVEPRRTLAEVLREDLTLRGTHLGCEHGVCGACTLLLNGEAVRSCLIFAVQADGAHVTTIEGVAGPDGLHPVQEAFRDNHSFQCGFCTPGFMLSALAFLKEQPNPSEDEIRDAMSGCICRCTGYQSIVAGLTAAAATMQDPHVGVGGEV